MVSVGLKIYSFGVFGKNAKQINLQNVLDGKNIIEIIVGYIKDNLSEYIDNNDRETIYKFVDWNITEIKDEGNNLYAKYLYGRIKTGNYGIESEIVDKTTGITTHNKKITEANVLPFDFLIILPAGNTYQTVFIMQTQGIYGIKTEFEFGFNSYLNKISNILKGHFSPLYPREYAETFLNNGILKKIKLFRYNIPRDEADRFGIIPGKRKKENQQVITVSSPLGFSRKKIEQIRECIYGIRTYNTVVQIDEFDYDDLRLEFRLGGKNKTISLKNIDKLVITQDITNEVNLIGGNPVKESIIPIMVDTGIEYLIRMGCLVAIEDLHEDIINQYVEPIEGDEVVAGSD